MAKRKNKSKKKKTRGGAGAAPWLGLIDIENRAQLLRIGVCLAIGCALGLGVWTGMGRLERKVHALERYEGALTLEWVDLPDWLELPDNAHILDALERRIDLRAGDHLLDRGLAERLGQTLRDPSLGWIASVERVKVRPDRLVTVKCRFRRPSAWVVYGNYCYLVGQEGVRLPGRYDVRDCRDSPMLMIDGVGIGPPVVGEVWRGADLVSGLHLASLLADTPYRHQITSIIVDNHDGREDRSRPHIELATDHRGSRIWWGRPPDQEFGAEITAAQKLTLLETLYRRWGRIDLNKAYVNIMTWPDKISLPAGDSSSKRRLLRG